MLAVYSDVQQSLFATSSRNIMSLTRIRSSPLGIRRQAMRNNKVLPTGQCITQRAGSIALVLLRKYFQEHRYEAIKQQHLLPALVNAFGRNPRMHKKPK